MPRLVHSLPQPRFHRASGQSRVRIAGREYWLGKHGSPEAQQAYDRLIAEFLANGRNPPTIQPPRSAPSVPDVGTTTVTVLVAEFWKWALTHYRLPDGTPSRESDNYRSIFKRLRKRYGNLPVEQFGSSKLLEFRDALVKEGRMARRTINSSLRRIRQVFRWGVARELVPLEVLAKLETVEPLQPGRGGRETSGSRGAVDFGLVEKTLPALPPLLQAFVLVAYHTGARRGELAKLTTGDLDRTGEVWRAELRQHKTSHKGKARAIFIGPRAQTALLPWLREDEPDEPIFSPQRADERQAKRKGSRIPGKYYVRSSLDQALRRAVDRAGVERWTLGQLRHSAAVILTDSAGLEAARQALGHSSAAMTRHYASGATAGAVEAARLLG